MPETPQKEPHHSALATVPRCLFCSAIGAWWDCHCEWGQKIRDGKLQRPRTVMRNGIPVIECCDELREAARAAGVIRVTDKPANAAPSVTIPVAVTKLVTIPREDVTIPTPVTDDVTIRHGERNCVRCGVGFVPRHPKAVYCSDACRQRAHRARDDES